MTAAIPSILMLRVILDLAELCVSEFNVEVDTVILLYFHMHKHTLYTMHVTQMRTTTIRFYCASVVLLIDHESVR